MSISDDLNEVFRLVFDDKAIQIDRSMTANDVDGWDSLSHVNLITAIEGKFRIQFSQKELLKMKNVGDLLTAIEGKLPK